jgi:hypothetical protein
MGRPAARKLKLIRAWSKSCIRSGKTVSLEAGQASLAEEKAFSVFADLEGSTQGSMILSSAMIPMKPAKRHERSTP